MANAIEVQTRTVGSAARLHCDTPLVPLKEREVDPGPVRKLASLAPRTVGRDAGEPVGESPVEHDLPDDRLHSIASAPLAFQAYDVEHLDAAEQVGRRHGLSCHGGQHNEKSSPGGVRCLWD
jgi:hypothetical protein